MELSNELLSAITVFNKYSKYVPETGTRESWEQLVTRNMEMHIKKYPYVEEEIRSAYNFVYAKQILPSMRSLQFGGRPVELANNRIYNCAYHPIDHIDAFSELMFLLLGGTGGGYSVQSRHVSQLPSVIGTVDGDRKFLVGDSIEGWADAIKVLVEAYFLGKSHPVFDLRDIREKGAALVTTGGKAPGPEPLRVCLNTLEALLASNIGKRLRPIDCHDMCCIIADAVLAGGIRRAALICLFDRYDNEMLDCKSGNWWEYAPQRGRANNSAVLPRGEVTKEEFFAIMKRVEDSGCGEPGVYWTNNLDWGTNPCLHPDSMVETVNGRIRIADIKEPVKVYTMLDDGTLGIRQASASWKTKCNADTLNITTSAGHTVRCTSNHEIYTTNRGWVEAGDIKIGDNLVHLRRSRRGAKYGGVSLTTMGNRESTMEHRLVAGSFSDIEGMDIHHLDGDTYNNDIDNLEALTHSEHSTLTRYECPNDHMITGYNEKLGKVGFISPDVRVGKTIMPMPNELKSNLRDQNSTKVVSITQGEVTDVYDLTVEGTHNFIADFTVVHNCCEIGLRPCQFCNLNEINTSDIVDQEDLNARSKAAAFIATLQAGYADFHYLRPIWRQTTEEDALIGVGMTGIGSGAILGMDLREAADIVVEENKRVAKLIGINPAARTTTVKPSGTSSLVVGSSSGIHGWHNDYYTRRMRLGKDEALCKYLVENIPALVEDDLFNPNGVVASFPQKAPDGAILRTESISDLLERVRLFNLDWVRPGHIS